MNSKGPEGPPRAQLPRESVPESAAVVTFWLLDGQLVACAGGEARVVASWVDLEPVLERAVEENR